MSGTGGGEYAGDIGARGAWNELERTPDATLVDVRTRAEWTYVGVPNLAGIGKQAVPVEWDDFQSGKVVPDFAGRLKAELEARGIGVEAMDSRAAARSWGVLRQEQRQIVGALFPL